MSMSFLFLFQGMAANMEVCEQIEEISHFIAHFQDHKQNEGYSFFEYVYEDYINDDGKPDNHHQESDHEDAPLHTSHQCCQHFVFFAPFQPTLINDGSSEEQNQINSYTFNINSRYLESLFQPPKV
ncbi:hypothetical protein [Cellulophaga baltica]|nr:hypothetical protein [Cellulophaga baltica]